MNGATLESRTVVWLSLPRCGTSRIPRPRGIGLLLVSYYASTHFKLAAPKRLPVPSQGFETLALAPLAPEGRPLLAMQGEVVLQGEILAAEAPPQQQYATEALPQQPYATAQPVYGQPQPVYSQPAPVAMPPAAPQTVQVQVPAGMMPGSVFNVQANGQMIPVTVPMGCKPGGLLTVQVPPRAAAVQQPVVVQQPGQTTVVQQVAGRAPPRCAPAGGIWCQRPFCGPITILVAIFLVPCVCCCPCDQREVYVVNGVEYLPSGAVVEKCCCDCS